MRKGSQHNEEERGIQHSDERGVNIVRKWSQNSEEERGSQHSEEMGVNIVRKGEST